MRNKLKHCNIAAFLIFVFIFALSVDLNAEITGLCSNCHTMHNSQGGQAVNANGVQEFLLNKGGGGKTTCWGCHAQGLALNVDSITKSPQVAHTNATDLSAGNFAYITGSKSLGTGTTTLTAGHNVLDTGVLDTNLASPPGDQHSTGITNANFTCAGQYGCHGDRTATTVGAAVKGAHHYDDLALKFGFINEANQALGSGSNGAQVGSSYRLLKGVKGGEDPDWHKTSGTTDHNEYKGATSMGASSKIAPAGNTISGLCAECHGNFHGTTSSECNSATPWVRHPTDTSLPASGEYTAYTTYSLVAPVARTTIPDSPSGTVTPGGSTDDILMCLSCHYAHASANYKMLRWDIKNSNLLTALSGCGVCHTSKQ